MRGRPDPEFEANLATTAVRLALEAESGLHPSTAPEAIASDQRAAVAEAVAELGPGATPERVSDRVCLPVDVTRRRMAELEALTRRKAG